MKFTIGWSEVALLLDACHRLGHVCHFLGQDVLLNRHVVYGCWVGIGVAFCRCVLLNSYHRR